MTADGSTTDSAARGQAESAVEPDNSRPSAAKRRASILFMAAGRKHGIIAVFAFAVKIRGLGRSRLSLGNQALGPCFGQNPSARPRFDIALSTRTPRTPARPVHHRV